MATEWKKMKTVFYTNCFIFDRLVQLNVKAWFRAEGVQKRKGHSEGRDTDVIFVQERDCHSSEMVSIAVVEGQFDNIFQPLKVKT